MSGGTQPIAGLFGDCDYIPVRVDENGDLYVNLSGAEAGSDVALALNNPTSDKIKLKNGDNDAFVLMPESAIAFPMPMFFPDGLKVKGSLKTVANVFIQWEEVSA